MNRKRVLFLTGSLNLGGTERNILHLATHLDSERFDVSVWSDYEGQPLQAALREQGIPCASLKQGASLGKPLLQRIFAYNLPYQRRMFKLLRENRNAIIHAFGFPMAYYAVLLGRAAGCKRIVFAVQDWDVWKKSLTYRILDRLCSRLAACVVADGEGARRLAVSRQGMAAGRFITIYDGVNTQEMTPTRTATEIRRELGLAADRPTIGVIARLDIAKKGQDIFINAIREVARAVPEAQFLIVGDGPDRKRVGEMCAELPESARPVLAGFRTDLADIIEALDILAIPSRWESVPKILLEAMWLRRPVVATRVGDIPEILDDACGVLVEPDDPSALAEAVVHLLKHESLREQFADAAHERIAERALTLDASVQAYEALYERI